MLHDEKKGTFFLDIIKKKHPRTKPVQRRNRVSEVAGKGLRSC